MFFEVVDSVEKTLHDLIGDTSTVTTLQELGASQARQHSETLAELKLLNSRIGELYDLLDNQQSLLERVAAR